MAINLKLSGVNEYFNGKRKNAIKGNVSVDVYMYYHVGGILKAVYAGCERIYKNIRIRGTHTRFFLFAVKPCRGLSGD